MPELGEHSGANKKLLENATYGLSALKDLIDVIDTIVDAILVDTGTTLEDKLDTIDTIVDAILVDTGTTLEAKLDNIVDKDSAPIVSTYPANADPVVLQATTTDWELGTWVEIIPENTITETFWIIGLQGAMNTNRYGYVELGTGASGSESKIVGVPSIDALGSLGYPGVIFPVPIKVAANTRIAGRLASKGTLADTIDVKVIYITGV